MENASKALIIAGAVLISILVISLGVMVFRNMSSSVRTQANMDKEQIAAFNGKISPYLGTNVSSSQVNDLIQVVRTINQSYLQGNSNVVKITMQLKDGATSKDLVWDNADKTAGSINVPSGRYYSVTATYTNGLYSNITVK